MSHAWDICRVQGFQGVTVGDLPDVRELELGLSEKGCLSEFRTGTAPMKELWRIEFAHCMTLFIATKAELNTVSC